MVFNTRYRILSLDASNIYEKNNYDGKGNEKEKNPYKIDSEYNGKLTPLYSSTS